MRCDDVTRELSAPGGRLAPSALAAHLAACPPCAAFAARAERLDRLWDATRPPSPPAGAFASLWAGVERASASPAPRRRRWVAVAGPALAASLLVAGLIAFRPTPAPLPARPQPPRVVKVLRVEIGDGQIVVIPIDGRDGARVVELPEEITADAVAPDLDVLNAFESLASESLASL